VAECCRERHQRTEKGRWLEDGSRWCTQTFWADAIELEAYVRSNTAHNIFILQGEVLEMVMLGEMSDISQFCEFAFYDWIMVRDQPNNGTLRRLDQTRTGSARMLRRLEDTLWS